MITIPITNLGGGVNSYSSSDNIGNHEIQSSSRNVRGVAENATLRKGYTTFSDLQTGGTSVAAFGAYIRNLAANDVLIMIYNNKIWKMNPSSDSTWTEITTSLLTSSTLLDTVAYRDWFFIFNGVDKPLRIAATTVTQPFTAPASLTANTFLPSFGTVYGSVLFTSGVPTAPNTVFCSKASTNANPEYVLDFSGTISDGDADEILFNSRVTAMRTLSSAAVIFTYDGAHYIPGLIDIGTKTTYDRQPIGGAGGCVSQNTSCVVENDIFYLTPQKEIKSVRRSQANQANFTTTTLSKKIQRFLKDNMADDMSTAFSYYDPINKYYKLYFKPTGGVMNLLCVVADLNKLDQDGVPTWYIDDSRPFSAGIFYKGQAYLGSAVLGQAYKDEDGLADDDDAAIVTVRTGKEMDANNPAALKNFRRVRIGGTITQATTVTAKVYVDGTLVASRVIDTSDLATRPAVGGIGTGTIGTFAIGEEADGDLSITNQYVFNQVITFRRRGKLIRVDLETDGVNNDYSINFIEYSFLKVSDLLNPVSEN